MMPITTGEKGNVSGLDLLKGIFWIFYFPAVVKEIFKNKTPIKKGQAYFVPSDIVEGYHKSQWSLIDCSDPDIAHDFNRG